MNFCRDLFPCSLEISLSSEWLACGLGFFSYDLINSLVKDVDRN